MGPKQSSDTNKEDKVEAVTINHPRFEKVKSLSGKDGEYLQISVPVVNETQIANWFKAYKSFMSEDSLMLARSFEFNGTQLCGSNGFCSINYDNYPFLLKEEINDRIQEKKYFENGELWYLAFIMIEAANIFHSRGKKVGDIRPLNVFICDNGQTKIANHLTWPQEMDNYEKALFQKQMTYLAPEEVIDLNFGLTEPRGNFEVAQSFSVGLTLLDSILLSDSVELYNYGNNRFLYQKLDEKMQRMMALPNVNHHLKQIVLGLCKTEPSQRFKCRDLYQWLSAFRQNIVNIEPFSIREIPPFMSSNASNQPQFFRQVQPPSYIESQVVANNPAPVLAARQVIYVSQPPPQIVRNVQYFQGPYQISSKSEVQRVEIGPQQVITSTDIKEVKKLELQAVQTNTESKQGAIVTNSDDFKLTLQKIEEQLALSRKMFPS